MKKNPNVAVMFIIILVTLLTGCSSSSPLVQTQPSELSHYRNGDVISRNDTDSFGIIILDYNLSLDECSYRIVLQKMDGSWGYYLPDFEASQGKRVNIEKNFTFLTGHLSDPTSIKSIDYNNPPKDVAYYQEKGIYEPTQIQYRPKYKIGDIIWKSSNSYSETLKADMVVVILSVDTINQKYTSEYIFRDFGSTTWYRLYPDPEVDSISTIDELYPAFIDNIDISKIVSKHSSKNDFESYVYGKSGTSKTYSSTSSTHFSGHGDDVVSFTTSGTGLRIFTMNHSGKSNFSIVLKDKEGEWVSLLVNEIGSYNSKKSERLESGTYYLDITADGSWTIDISS